MFEHYLNFLYIFFYFSDVFSLNMFGMYRCFLFFFFFNFYIFFFNTEPLISKPMNNNCFFCVCMVHSFKHPAVALYCKIAASFFFFFFFFFFLICVLNAKGHSVQSHGN